MMRTRTKWIAALSVVALAGVGLVAAQSTTSESGGAGAWFRPFHRGPPGPPAHVFALCDDNITVGECKELLKAKHDERLAAMEAKCIEEHGQEFCDELKEMLQNHRRPGGPHGPPPGAEDGESEESDSSTSESA